MIFDLSKKSNQKYCDKDIRIKQRFVICYEFENNKYAIFQRIWVVEKYVDHFTRNGYVQEWIDIDSGLKLVPLKRKWGKQAEIVI